jgi:hypothetical protein
MRLAIKSPLALPRLKPLSDDKQALLDAMRGHIIAYGELVGRFGN